MTLLPFVKIQGAGNDFVVVESNQLGRESFSTVAPVLCDRNYGVGSDGLIVIATSTHADAKMVFYNPDGTRDVCGNGMRCVARYLYDRKPFHSIRLEIDEDFVDIESIDSGRLFRVKMSIREKPALKRCATPHGEIEGWLLNSGTPHFVVSVSDLSAVPFQELGSLLEHHPDLPTSVSVDFVQPLSEHRAKILIWERSVGETLACGTAACSVAAVGTLHSFLKFPVEIESKGGVLTIEAAPDGGLFLTGPAETVFKGSMELSDALSGAESSR